MTLDQLLDLPVAERYRLARSDVWQQVRQAMASVEPAATTTVDDEQLLVEIDQLVKANLFLTQELTRIVRERRINQPRLSNNLVLLGTTR